MKKLLIANWKMQLTHNEACTWLETELPSVLETLSHTEHELVICPSYTMLPYATSLYEDLAWGAQDCGFEEKGSYTGDISVLSLKDLGITYTLVGHSERRHYHAESDELISLKASLLLKHTIHPVVCIGETLGQIHTRRSIIQEQLAQILPLYHEHDRGIIAYEPVWAIGTGIVPSHEELADVLSIIREIMGNATYLLLYGGSVQETQAKLLSPLVDGFLIGASSLRSEELKKIILSC